MHSTSGEGKFFSASTSAQTCRLSLAEIKSATRGFDDELIIGQGGFGKVYKGRVSIEETRHVVAIKRLDSMSNQGAVEFRAEIEMLSELRHCHLVSLISYCEDNKEMILVYEYMPHGTLYDHLHKADTPLSWVQRLKIAIGAARGLDYLHTGIGTQHGIIHRDVKSSNILLDENWEAMISDFGLSKIGPTNQSVSYIDTSIKGTFGYLDPEYFYTRRLTRKTDVFAFGVVLFELLSGRLAVDVRLEEDQWSLVRWAKKRVKEQRFDQMVDSKIAGTIAPKCLRRFAKIAYQCLISVPKERPTMTEVVASLQALLELQEKCDNSANSSYTMGFARKIHKYLDPTAKQNCGQSDVKIFTYDELKHATRNFSNKIYVGGGSYAKMYKGWVGKNSYLPNQRNAALHIAVKKLHYYKSIKFDLGILKEFRHPNLVKLIGYCLEGEKLFLVYELPLNGNFENLLRNGGLARLPLVTKVKMAVGIARGISFLRSTQLTDTYDEFEYDIWAGPVRLERSDILVDEDYTPRLSDYDVSKLVHGHYHKDGNDHLLDHYPWFDPCQLRCNLSGFKVVFAELLIGKHIYNPTKLWKINPLFSENGSLDVIAGLCFERCNEVNIETEMVITLKEYDHELIKSSILS